ncbi:unnamed protein product [Closterium sp. Yama58-4]|nr:unnamed protein product [Closterium sp. Yama58-4]
MAHSCRIHGEFMANAWRIHSEFMASSWRIYSEFEANSWQIHGEFMALLGENAEALLSLGALQLLLPLAQDSMASVRSAATLSLGRLTNVSHTWSHPPVQRNVLPSLCKALTGTNRHHKRAAAYLVKAVSRHAGAELAEAGVLPLLTECLLGAMLAVWETAAQGVSMVLAPSLHFTLQMLFLRPAVAVSSYSSAAARTTAGAAAISQAGGFIAQSSQHCADLSHCFATVASPHRNQQDPSAEAEIAGSNDQEADSVVLSGAGDDGSRSGAERAAGSSDGRSDGDDGFRVRSEPWIFNLTEIPPDSTAARLSEESKENMWLLHQKDPGHWSVARLAREYRVRQQRVHAILWLKDLEKKMEEEQGKPLDDSIAKEFEKQHGSYDKAVGERHVKIYPSEAVDSLPEGPERMKLLLQESEKEEMWKLDEFVKRMEFNKKQMADGPSVDATDQAAIKAAITSIDEECPIDVLQCNAGIVRTGFVEDISAEDVQSQVHTNFLGSVYPVQAVLPSMKARAEAGEEPGAIVFTCSLAALSFWYGASIYTATKYAVRGFAEALRLELLSFALS